MKNGEIRSKFALDSSSCTISAGTIKFTGNTLVVESTNFNLNADGTVSITGAFYSNGSSGNATIRDGNIHLSALNADGNRYNTISLSYTAKAYVAVWALMPLFRAKIGRYQCASIPGRGQVDGKRAIERFIRRKDPHGTKSKYFVKMDVRHCYQNLTRRAVMRRLRRDVHKNPVLLWFVDTLLSTFQHGFSIGSFLSQFLCNYMLSYAYHFATEQLYKIRKRRTGKAARVRLVGFVLFYMDDILFIGAAFKDVKKAARLFCAYLRDELGLEIKPIWHVKALAKEPIDIMGFVIRRDSTTVRARIFVRARRQFLRAWAYLEAGGYITIKAARRIISYRGYFSHTDSVEISAKLHIVEVSRAASNVISAAARAELAAA